MRHLSALILLAAATTFTASAQTVMKVKMTSGETTEIPVGKIENVTFGETSEPEQPEAGRPVDLGLSVLWADRNVGATSEFDPGIQCGWGDPTGEKASDDLDDYPSPLPPENISGTEYDIARAKWGAPWRMPTWEEVYELESKVSAASGYAYGTYYLKATSENGNGIYFPCETEYQGKYWSRKIQSAKPEFSCSLNHFISSATIDDHGGTSGSVTLHFIKLREGLYQIR